MDYIDAKPQHHSIQQPHGCAPFGGGVTKSDAAGEATLEEHPGCSPRSLALVRRGLGRMATLLNPGQKNELLDKSQSHSILLIQYKIKPWHLCGFWLNMIRCFGRRNMVSIFQTLAMSSIVSFKNPIVHIAEERCMS